MEWEADIVGKKYKIVAINLGSTSTKIAYYINDVCQTKTTLAHNPDEIAACKTIWDQYELRERAILRFLEESHIDPDNLDAFCSRGGHTEPVEGGTYRINEKMAAQNRSGKYGTHVGNVGLEIAYQFCREHKKCLPLTVDLPTTDEFNPLAKYSGLKEIRRRSRIQMLNTRAMARYYAKKTGRKYEEMRLIVTMLGGGISTSAHVNGRVVDGTDGIAGEGTFSNNRSCGLPVGDLVELCYSGKYTREEMLRKINGEGGLMSYLGTMDFKSIVGRAERGDEKCSEVIDAMAYQTAKDIGGLSTVLNGEVDAILLIGGMANSEYLTQRIQKRVQRIAPVVIIPGELEMESLCEGAFRAMIGEIPLKEFIPIENPEQSVIANERPSAFRSFREIEEYVLSHGEKKTIALACAQDKEALSALVEAKRRGIAKGILIGDVLKIEAVLKELGEDPAEYPMIACDGERECAQMAIRLVLEGGADLPMKGLMQTANFMRAVLDKANGYVPNDALLSQITVLEDRTKKQMLLISDCAVNISPTVQEKRKIIYNTVGMAARLGYRNPKVAVLSAIEKATPKIASSMEAEELAEMEWDGCQVDGPFALDNALDEASAKHKGIQSPVAGNADVLIMPDLDAGNIFTKSLTFFAGMDSAGVLYGTTRPVIMTSRTDTIRNKYYSILLSVLQSIQG